MNEVEELIKLNSKSLPELKPILHDDLHQKVRKNLYLELGSGPVLYLLSPSYTVINPAPNEKINDFIRKEENKLNYLKEYIIQNLTVHSVLLDVNSYFIEQNKLMGMGIGFIDAHLLASAQLSRILLWRSDKRLRSASFKLNVAYK